MSAEAIATMIIVLGIVFGGLIFFFIKAFSYEKKKERDGEV